MAVQALSTPRVSRTAGVAARILLGLIFTAAGASAALILGNPPPPPPGLAGEFQNIFFQSHWVVLVDAVEFCGGVLLLANRYVAFALTMLAAVIVNILFFHIALMPAGLPVALFVAVLWILATLPYRSRFAALLIAK
jgi:general stress protein CsbA